MCIIKGKRITGNLSVQKKREEDHRKSFCAEEKGRGSLVVFLVLKNSK